MATLKQKKAFQETGVNGGNLSKAMKAAGYSESSSKRTDKLTNTKGWKELMEEYLPDKLLAKKHNELLNAKVRTRQYKKGDLEYETEELDTTAIGKGLDMAYKLKGAYSPDKIEHSGGVKTESNIDIEAIAQEIEDRLKEKKLNETS